MGMPDTPTIPDDETPGQEPPLSMDEFAAIVEADLQKFKAVVAVAVDEITKVLVRYVPFRDESEANALKSAADKVRAL